MIKLSCNRVNLDKLKAQAAAAQRRIPLLMGADAVAFTKNNFRVQGFVDTTVQPWPQRKSDPDPGRGILIGKGTAHLFKDIRILRRELNSVYVGTSIPYARIHNDGGTISHPGGTAFIPGKERRWVSNNTAARLATAGRNLPRTRAHRITIPKRRFLGKSVALTISLKKILANELRKLNNK